MLLYSPHCNAEATSTGENFVTKQFFFLRFQIFFTVLVSDMTSWPAALVPILLISLLTLLLVVFLLASIKNLPSTKVRALFPIFLVPSHPYSGGLPVGIHQEPSLYQGENSSSHPPDLPPHPSSGGLPVGLHQEPSLYQGESSGSQLSDPFSPFFWWSSCWPPSRTFPLARLASSGSLLNSLLTLILDFLLVSVLVVFLCASIKNTSSTKVRAPFSILLASLLTLVLVVFLLASIIMNPTSTKLS